MTDDRNHGRVVLERHRTLSVRPRVGWKAAIAGAIHHTSAYLRCGSSPRNNFTCRWNFLAFLMLLTEQNKENCGEFDVCLNHLKQNEGFSFAF